ncbi:MAG TPA: ABC-F family ATP-binding cassette domain-containing protein [Chitinophagales bacterium]|nr:ABC-F family ATP-binding cassette domain-containing protein [Chitinophagales bacterium]HPE97386.1 ABC-F family ATP-binding cassette domain-containing protein [Chitinophagales bacterium]HPR29605.1 ABC-F family ATP-binding cassette domain-containing protein [Chitinophagales bacterium]HRX23724.1 ABC-F family ATP-binding cassette domain-containing protein [Chitinophagales bacterium]
MIAIQNLSLHFGGQTIFEGISCTLREGERVGLVGKNGAGKSTLLRVLSGEQEVRNGQVVLPKGDTIGYLKQELSNLKGRTVYEETVSAFDEALRIEARLTAIEKELEQHTDTESTTFHDLMEEMHELSHRFEIMDVGSVEKQVEQVLTGLGFDRNDLQRPVETFSGGWQMRIELAKILLRKPEIVLLDEPTNHLDIESIQWLEQYLQTYPGAIVLVSHDRSFLDNVTNRTIEIVNGKIYDYPVAYTDFTALRQERIELQSAAQRNQEKHIEHTEQLIEKFRYKASKAKFAQTLIHKLEKMDRIEVDDEESASIQFVFPQPPRSGKLVVEASGLSKSYGSKEVLRDLQFNIERGDRIALLGKNGEGKSTLSRIIASIEPYTGTCRLGHNVTVGYYAQNQADTLKGDESVFDVIDQVATGEIRTKIRGLLGAFLFRGDAIYKKVSVLSGGEKSRLALCRLLLQPSNLLILDEPTNHLDMRSKDVLKEALLRFDGTVILVSHDREFLQGMTNRIFHVANLGIKEYLGDVHDYLESRKQETTGSIGQVSKPKKGQAEKADYNKRKEQEKNQRKLERAVQQAEQEIHTLEKSIADMELKLKDPEFFKKLAHDDPFFAQYEAEKEKLEKAMGVWERAAAELEALKP